MRAGTGVTSQELPIPVVRDSDRLHFDVRVFAETWNLDGASGGGAHMWREIWDDDVSTIYKDILSKPFYYYNHIAGNYPLTPLAAFSLEKEEPVFGQPPKVDVYAEMKKEKKYIL